MPDSFCLDSPSTFFHSALCSVRWVPFPSGFWLGSTDESIRKRLEVEGKLNCIIYFPRSFPARSPWIGCVPLLETILSGIAFQVVIPVTLSNFRSLLHPFTGGKSPPGVTSPRVVHYSLLASLHPACTFVNSHFIIFFSSVPLFLSGTLIDRCNHVDASSNDTFT